MKVMTQEVKSGDEVTPLDQLSQWPTSECCLRYPNLIQDCTRMHQDLFWFFHECIFLGDSNKEQVANMFFWIIIVALWF